MKTTINKLTELLGGDYEKCESPSLLLSKFGHFSADSKNSDFKRKDLNSVLYCYDKNRKEVHASLTHPKIITLELILRGRLLINHCGGLHENTGLCLNHLFNYPFIPGSAIKGCVRHYVWEQWKNENDEEVKKTLAAKIALSFGYPTGEDKLDKYIEKNNLLPSSLQTSRLQGQENSCQCEGNVAFLPAYPKSPANLVMDILTCHHMEYYTNPDMEKFPIAYDNETPNIQNFIAVEKGSKFVFQVLALRSTADIEWIRKNLRQALEFNGLGAKKTAGYGWFQEDPQVVKQRQEQEQQDKEAEQKAIAQADREKAIKDNQDKLHQESIKQLQDVAFTPFGQFVDLNWKKLSSKITDIYKANENLVSEKIQDVVFSEERQQELMNVILEATKVKPSDLNGGKKSLIKWLGEERAKQILEQRGR